MIGLTLSPRFARQRSWEYGPFAYYGNGIGDRSDYRFFAAGVQAGKLLTPVMHAGILSGQFEFAGNIMPFWQAYTPAPHYETFVSHGGSIPLSRSAAGHTPE